MRILDESSGSTDTDIQENCWPPEEITSRDFRNYSQVMSDEDLAGEDALIPYRTSHTSERQKFRTRTTPVQSDRQEYRTRRSPVHHTSDHLRVATLIPFAAREFCFRRGVLAAMPSCASLFKLNSFRKSQEPCSITPVQRFQSQEHA